MSIIYPYRNYEISRIERRGPIAIIEFNGSIYAKPGQYVMVKKDGLDEKPFSVARLDPFTLAVKVVGDFTKAMYDSRPGDTFRVRGPYGNGYPIDKFYPNTWIIAGGIGVAGVLLLLDELLKNPQRRITVFYAARTTNELVFLEDMNRADETHIITDSSGWMIDLFRMKPFPPDPEENPLSIAMCGKEVMQDQIASILKGHTSLDRIYCNVEGRIRCAHGICGSCQRDGETICTGGPVYTLSYIFDHIPSFGRWERDQTGALVPKYR